MNKRLQDWATRVLQCPILLVAAICFILAGCSDPGKNLDIKPQGAQMTPRDAMRIAKDAAQREGMNLSDYKEPEANYASIRAKTWQVFFEGQKSASGKHFYIYIDDESGETHYMAGQ